MIDNDVHMLIFSLELLRSICLLHFNLMIDMAFYISADAVMERVVETGTKPHLILQSSKGKF